MTLTMTNDEAQDWLLAQHNAAPGPPDPARFGAAIRAIRAKAVADAKEWCGLPASAVPETRDLGTTFEQWGAFVAEVARTGARVYDGARPDASMTLARLVEKARSLIDPTAAATPPGPDSEEEPTYLGYHSPTPRYKGQEPMSGDCDILGGTCFYDGSGEPS